MLVYQRVSLCFFLRVFILQFMGVSPLDGPKFHQFMGVSYLQGGHPSLDRQKRLKHVDAHFAARRSVGFTGDITKYSMDSYWRL